MSDEHKTQHLFTSFGGRRYIAIYAGVAERGVYFKCKDLASNSDAGFVAMVAPGKFGPLCKDCDNARLRAKNVAQATQNWLEKAVYQLVKNKTM